MTPANSTVGMIPAEREAGNPNTPNPIATTIPNNQAREHMPLRSFISLKNESFDCMRARASVADAHTVGHIFSRKNPAIFSTLLSLQIGNCTPGTHDSVGLFHLAQARRRGCTPRVVRHWELSERSCPYSKIQLTLAFLVSKKKQFGLAALIPISLAPGGATSWCLQHRV